MKDILKEIKLISEKMYDLYNENMNNEEYQEFKELENLFFEKAKKLNDDIVTDDVIIINKFGIKEACLTTPLLQKLYKEYLTLLKKNNSDELKKKNRNDALNKIWEIIDNMEYWKIIHSFDDEEMDVEEAKNILWIN